MNKVSDKDKIIKALLEVSRAVSSSLDPEKVGRLAIKELLRVLDIDHVALFLATDDTARPMLADAAGFSHDQMKNINILRGWESINERLVKTKKPIIVNGIGKSSALPFNSFLAAPLIDDKKIIGTLISSRGRRSVKPFLRSDAEFLQTLSNYISIALASARLFSELSAIQAEAAQTEKMAVLGTIAGSINHEIRSPLALARTKCDSFLFDMKEGLYQSWGADKTIARAKETMIEAMTYMDKALSIAQELSDFARPSKGICEPVDVSAEIDEVMKILGHELNFSGIEVKKDIDGKTSRIFTDRKRFQEVMFNLLRNAAQAIETRGTITIESSRRKKRVIIDIKDTGSGIPKEKVKDLFKPFFTTKEPGKGTGIGLFIIKKIIEKNGGEIYLKKTNPGKGTTFTVEFPECL